MLNIVSAELLENLMQSLFAVCILITFSISGRFMLVLAGQHWVKTFSHTATLVVLPVITFVIVKVISGNIALSLGMVGALSIVRFRNPVKSPFELAVYFGSITMGITASVSLPWLFFFALAIFIAISLLFTLDLLSKFLFKRPMFQTSFSEGNQLATLHINAKVGASDLMKSEKLISYTSSDEGYSYVLASDNFDELKVICENAEMSPSVSSCQLNS
jgi:hypothetical protein